MHAYSPPTLSHVCKRNSIQTTSESPLSWAFPLRAWRLPKPGGIRVTSSWRRKDHFLALLSDSYKWKEFSSHTLPQNIKHLPSFFFSFPSLPNGQLAKSFIASCSFPFCFCQSGKSVIEEVWALPIELTAKCHLEADSVDDGWESVCKCSAPRPTDGISQAVFAQAP